MKSPPMQGSAFPGLFNPSNSSCLSSSVPNPASQPFECPNNSNEDVIDLVSLDDEDDMEPVDNCYMQTSNSVLPPTSGAEQHGMANSNLLQSRTNPSPLSQPVAPNEGNGDDKEDEKDEIIEIIDLADDSESTHSINTVDDQSSDESENDMFFLSFPLLILLETVIAAPSV